MNPKTYTTPSGAVVDEKGNLISTPPAFSTTSLAPATAITVPPPVDVTSPQQMNGIISGNVDSLSNVIKNLQTPTAAENDQATLRKQILDSLTSLSDKTSRTLQLQNEKGLPEMQTQLQDVTNQLQGLQKEALAIPLQIQQESTGRGITRGGVEPIQAGRLRENAIKSLSLSAIGSTLQNNIALAQSQVDRAVQLEFEPQEKKLDYLKQLYSFNQQDLERNDRKKADALKIMIDERSRLLENEKINKNEIYNIGLTAQKFGADANTVQRVFAAKTREEAVSAAGGFLTDPKAKIELANLNLDNQLKKANIAKIQKETYLLDHPVVTKEQIKAEQKAMEQAKSAIPVLQDKLDLIDAIKTSPALNSVVGPNALTRSQPGFFRNIGKALTVVGLPAAVGGAFERVTGNTSNFLGNVNQLTSKEFVDTLVNAKAEGATFGALNEQEGNALKAAATKINSWAIKDKNGNVTGYNIDEKDFKDELDRIKNSANIVMQRLQGNVLSTDEESTLDNLFGRPASITPGLNFYK